MITIIYGAFKSLRGGWAAAVTVNGQPIYHTGRNCRTRPAAIHKALRMAQTIALGKEAQLIEGWKK